MADDSIGKGTAPNVGDLLGLRNGGTPTEQQTADGTTAQAAPDASHEDAAATATELEVQAAAEKHNINLDGDYELGDRVVKGREIVQGMMASSDYTRKTQALAEEKAQLEKEKADFKDGQAWLSIVANDPALSIATTAIARGMSKEEAYRLMDEARGKSAAAPVQSAADQPPVNPSTGRPYEPGDIEFEEWKVDQKLKAELSARDQVIEGLKSELGTIKSTLERSQKESEAERKAREQAEAIAAHNQRVVEESEVFVKNKFGEDYQTRFTPDQLVELGKRIGAVAKAKGIHLDNPTWRSQNIISEDTMENIILKTDFNPTAKPATERSAAIANQSVNNRMSAGGPSVGALAPATDVDERPAAPSKQFDDMFARSQPVNNRK